MWLKWRLLYAFSDVEGTRIAAAHDPIVVADRDRVLVTEQTLRGLRDAAVWVAQQTGRPKPDAQYIDNMRNTIKRQWQSWPKDSLTALSFSVKTFPAAVEYTMGVLPEGKRKEVFTAWGKEFGAEPHSTLHTASTMFYFYHLLVEQGIHEEILRQAIQVESWSFNRMAKRGFCNTIYAGQVTTGAGPYCTPIE